MTASWYIRDGLRLNVSEIGSGQTLVFQHGLCADAAQPAEVFPEGKGWRCLTLECRGHGRSDAGPPERMSIATFADDLAALIEARAEGAVVLGGISLGAAIALRLAVRRPELVRGLFLARPAWVDGAAPANLLPNALVGELLARFSPGEARSRFEASEEARQLAVLAPDNLSSLRGFFSREPVTVTSELLRRISSDGPGVSRREIEALRVPALVLGTARDRLHPLAHLDALARMIPGARRREIASKAESRERYRDELRAALSDFLGGLGA
jgi:pimeloyl-ACP methyl ester carboxylesterase